MAFSDDALRAKLATLNETQDSIVSVSQWITFHKYVMFLRMNSQADNTLGDMQTELPTCG